MSFAHGNRIVLDRSGGKGELPLEALLLPSRLVIGHDGSERRLTAEPIGSNEARVRKSMGGASSVAELI